MKTLNLFRMEARAMDDHQARTAQEEVVRQARGRVSDPKTYYTTLEDFRSMMGTEKAYQTGTRPPPPGSGSVFRFLDSQGSP